MFLKKIRVHLNAGNRPWDSWRSYAAMPRPRSPGRRIPRIPTPSRRSRLRAIRNAAPLVIYGHLEEKEGDVYSLRRVRADIHNLFASGDFSDIKVDAQPGVKQGQVFLTFKVVERPLVAKILFTGNKKWGAGKFTEEIKTAVKSPFDPSRVNEDLDSIKKLYLDEGYPNVAIASKAGPTRIPIYGGRDL